MNTAYGVSAEFDNLQINFSNITINEGDDYIAIYQDGTYRIGKCKKNENWNLYKNQNGAKTYFKIHSMKSIN